MEENEVKKGIEELLAPAPKKGTSFLIKILIALVLGFLPSFLFVALFVQSGSPVSNYITYLSNLNSSLGAWVSAGVIFLFVLFIFWLTHKTSSKRKRNKFLLVVLIFSLLIILSLVAMQFYLYLNYALRNDILVKLSADQDNIFFTDNLENEINFKIAVTMNPFCSAECKFSFFDISTGEMIDSGQFNISSILSKTKTYTIKNLGLVQGSQILDTFVVSCTSKKTLLCYTSEQESKRSALVTINYDLSEENKLFKNSSKEEIISLSGMFYRTENTLNESLTNLNLINTSFSIEDSEQTLTDFMNRSSDLSDSLIFMIKLWEAQKFSLLKTDLPEFQDEIQTFYSESENLSTSIIANISVYNTLVDTLTNSRKMLAELSAKNLDASQCTDLNSVVSDFNAGLIQIAGGLSLSDKSLLVETLSSEVSQLYIELQNAAGAGVCVLTHPISEIAFAKITPYKSSSEIIPVSLNEPSSVCCYHGTCQTCCDETCSAVNYPVIFLHGQSINKALPADYSFDTFLKIKSNLVSEGYIDAGSVILSQSGEIGGLWGKSNTSMIMTASYFFDTYKTDTGEKTISSNSDSIDTYAIRLKSIVELVKSRTNKDKVILVAHSMGGAVARRYIQVFGGENVEKVILITVPNHGVDDKVSAYCGVIGPAASCSDLDKNSIFMNKLNNAPTDIVPTYNIIGYGCAMGDDTGDGIIKNSSQYLSSATNYYFKGTCNELSFEYFHEFIIDSDKYPEVYKLIRTLLEAKND